MGAPTPWLLGPRPLLAQHLLQCRLGERAGVAAVPSLWAYATHRGCLNPPPGQGGDGPFLAQCLLAGAPDPRGLYIHFCAPPLPRHMHVIFYSQSVALPPASSALPTLLGCGGDD